MPVSAEKAVAEFIASEMRRMFPTSQQKKKEPGQYSLQQIADTLGVTKPQVASALKSAEGIGNKFERQFAAKFYGGSIDRLRKAAEEWARGQPHLFPPPSTQEATSQTGTPPSDGVLSRWARRDDAARFTRSSGDIPEAIIEAVHARCTDPKYYSWTQLRWTDEYRTEYERESAKTAYQRGVRDVAATKPKTKKKKTTAKRAVASEPEKKPKSTRRTGTE